MKTRKEIAERVLDELYDYVEDYTDSHNKVPDQSPEYLELGYDLLIYCDVDYNGNGYVNEIRVETSRRDSYPNLSRYIEDYVQDGLHYITDKIEEVKKELYAPHYYDE